jgi:hypothetical protein
LRNTEAASHGVQLHPRGSSDRVAIAAKLLAAPAACALQRRSATMTKQPSAPVALESVSSDELSHVIGGGIGATLGGLFGAKGAKWGGFADQIFGMFQGMSSQGSSSAGSPASTGQGSSGGGLSGITGFLGNIGKLFGGFGGSSSGSQPQPQPQQGQ